MRLITFPTLEKLPNLFFLMNTIPPYREEDIQWEHQQKVPCSYLPQWKSVRRRGTEPRNLVIACLLSCHDNRQNPLIKIPSYNEFSGFFLSYFFFKGGGGQLHLLKVTPGFEFSQAQYCKYFADISCNEWIFHFKSLRPWNINWQNWKYTLSVIFICYSQTFDVTMQWVGTNLLRMSLKTLDWNSYCKVDFQSTCFTQWCRANVLKKIQRNTSALITFNSNTMINWVKMIIHI